MKKGFYIVIIFMLFLGCAQNSSKKAATESVSTEESVVKESPKNKEVNTKESDSKPTINYDSIKAIELKEDDIIINEDIVEVNDIASEDIEEMEIVEEEKLDLNFETSALSFQKLQQVMEIALLLQDKEVDTSLKDNAIVLAESIFSHEVKSVIKQQLLQLNLPKSDSIQISGIRPVSIKKIDDTTRITTSIIKINYFYKGNLITSHNKQTSVQVTKKDIVMGENTVPQFTVKIIELHDLD